MSIIHQISSNQAFIIVIALIAVGLVSIMISTNYLGIKTYQKYYKKIHLYFLLVVGIVLIISAVFVYVLNHKSIEEGKMKTLTEYLDVDEDEIIMLPYGRAIDTFEVIVGGETYVVSFKEREIAKIQKLK